jgi:hypothetical protein
MYDYSRDIGRRMAFLKRREIRRRIEKGRVARLSV